jgi:hypothetical protein
VMPSPTLSTPSERLSPRSMSSTPSRDKDVLSTVSVVRRVVVFCLRNFGPRPTEARDGEGTPRSCSGWDDSWGSETAGSSG